MTNPGRQLACPTKYKAIIFDMFGTLVDTESGSLQAAGRILQQYPQVNINAREFYPAWRNLYKQVLDTLPAFQNEAWIYTQALRLLYGQLGITGNAEQDAGILFTSMRQRKPYPDTLEILTWLQPRVMVIIGSNSDFTPFYANIAQHGIIADFYFCSEELQCYKPVTEFYYQILKHTGLTAREVLMVGDCLQADVAGPQAAGIAAAWLNRQKIKRTAGCNPDYEIHSLVELKALI